MKQKLFSIFCCLLLSASMVTQGQVIAVPEGEQLTEQQLRDISMAIQQDAANDVSFVPVNKMKRAGEGSATKTTQRRAAQDYYATWTWSDFNAGGYALEGTVSGSGSNVVKLYRYQWNANLKIYFAFKTSAAGSYTTPGGTTIVAPKTGNYTIQQSLSDLKVANIDSKLSNKWKNSLYIEDGGNYYFKSGTITVAEGADGPLITSNGVTTNDLDYDYDPISICIGSSPQYCTVSVQSENTTKGTVTSTYQSGYVYSTRSSEYKKNSVYRLVATPKSGYHFDHWSDGGAQTHNVTITGNATYTAYFASDATPTHTISTAVSPAGYGTVSGGGTYDENSNRTLTATSANAHLYIFDHWLKNGNTFTGNTSNPLNITVTADATYTAVFRNAAAGTITAEPDDAMHGTVTGGGNYAGGATATLTASPLYDYQFIKWSDGVTTASRTVYVDGNATYTAEFGRVMQIKIPNALCNDATNQNPGWFQYVAEDDEWRVLIAIYSNTFGGSYTESDCALANCKIIDKAENETIMVSTLSATTWSNADGIRRIDANIMGDDGKRYHVVLGAPQQSGASYDNGEDIDLTYTSCSVQTSRPDLYNGSMSFSNDNTRYLKAQKSEGGYTYSLWLEIYTGSGGSIPTGVYPITATNSTGNALAQHTINDYYGVPTLIGGTSLTKYNSGWDDIYFWMIRAGSIAIVNNSGTYFAEVNAINSNGKKVHAIIGTKPNFTVTASGDHGTVTLSAPTYANQTTTGSYQYGTRVTLTPVAASGYEFAGWTGTDVSEIREKDGVFSVKVGVKNLNVTPVFVNNGIITHTLDWDVNGGTLVGTAGVDYLAAGEYEEGTTITLPDATREGYTLDYWSFTMGGIDLEESAGAEIDLDEDVTFTAQWTPNEYTITLNNQSATMGGTSSQTVDYRTPLPNITVPTKTGNAFGGYFTETNGGGTMLIGTDGKWVKNVSGYTDASGNLIHADDFELFAKWTELVTFTIASYSNGTVTVTPNDGSGAFTSGSRDLAVGTMVSFSAVASTNYHISTVNLNINGSDNSFSATSAYTLKTGDGTVTLTADFLLDTYTITYKDQGDETYSGDNLASLPDTHTYNAATALVDGEKGGYNFLGWYDNAACTGDALTTIGATAKTADFTLYAKWEVAARTVTITAPTGGTITVTDGTTAITSGSQAYSPNSTITLTATPATDYEFVSWNSGTPALTDETTEDGVVSGTFTLTKDTTVGATFRRVRYYELTLLDNESADYYNSFASRYNGAKVDEVTYERTFVVGRWSTVCLPFTVAVEEIDPIWEQVYEFVRATGDANTTGDGMMLYFRKATTLLAGKCYLVYNTGVSDISSTTFTDVTINTTADKADITSLEGYKDEGDISLVGTLRKGTLPANNHTYMALSNNTIYWPGDNGITVRAYRGFFKDADPSNPGIPQRVRIVVEGEVVTDLEIMENGELRMDNDNVRKYMDNGVLIIERNGIRYDAQGKRIEN